MLCSIISPVGDTAQTEYQHGNVTHTGGGGWGWGVRERERERETERDRDRERERNREKQTDRQTIRASAELALRQARSKPTVLECRAY